MLCYENINTCTQPLKKRSLASCYSFYERLDSIASFLKQKLNGAVLNWVTMNQGWWLKNQIKKNISMISTYDCVHWGIMRQYHMFFEKHGILSPEMASENRPNGKSKNLCWTNAQQNQGGNYTIFRLQDHLTFNMSCPFCKWFYQLSIPASIRSCSPDRVKRLNSNQWPGFFQWKKPPIHRGTSNPIEPEKSHGVFFFFFRLEKSFGGIYRFQVVF